MQKNQIVIHLAAKLGGISVNRNSQADFFYDNSIMALNLIKEGQKKGIKKFLGIGSIWEYPDNLKAPFKEKSIWNGYPAEITAPYGLAKRFMLTASDFYSKQYKLDTSHLLLTNLYGPGDNFDPKKSHVIPSLINKIYDAKIKNKKSISVWGDGSASRDLLFVKDAARAITIAAFKSNISEPINIGSGKETTIKELVKILFELMGYNGKVKWKIDALIGQKNNRLDTSKSKQILKFSPKFKLVEGLKETIKSYYQLK